ncbi:DMT family transporter [Halodesulfovibrio aestuarii]|uniref:DMT family transporter n=1 Tax=Halodesulfovibrio aestuarii TaxID=126333 RepID=UPI003520B406
MKLQSSVNIESLVAQRNMQFARTGILIALFSGMTWGLDGVVLGSALTMAPFIDPELWLLAPLTAAAMHDATSAFVITAINIYSGKSKEIFRSLLSKPGKFICLGALMGGPIGMGGYLLALKFAGPAFVLPITTLYPAIASLLAVVVLKENISKLAWAGLGMCILGAIVIGYTPPSGETTSQFYYGIAFAFLATIGWGSEGVCSTYGMDLLDPSVVLNIRQLVSATTYLLVILPIAGGYMILTEAAWNISGDLILFAGVLGAASYLTWYRAMNMTGVSRAMGINVTYALWGIIFSSVFMDTEITATLVIGAIIITAGMIMVVGNPKNMTTLRNVN